MGSFHRSFYTTILLNFLASFGVSIGLSFATVARAEPPILRISMESPPSDRALAAYLMRGLMRSSPHPNGTRQIICDLCKSWEVTPDGRTYTFKLDTEIKWSDDAKLDAAQFVETFRERLAGKSQGLATARELSRIETQPWGVSAPNPATLVIRLKEPSVYFLDALTLAETFPTRKSKDRVGAPVLGPYMLAAHEKSRIVLEGNPNFTGTRPVYRVEFIFGAPDSLLAKFRAGKLDILTNPTTEVLLKHTLSRVQISPYWATRELVFNLRKGARASALQDPSLRRAIDLALDPGQLPQTLRNGDTQATSLVPPQLPGAPKNMPAPRPAERAKLAQAERHRATPWPNWVSLRLITQNVQTHRQIAEWIEENLKSIHVRVQTTVLKDREFSARLKQGDFDLALILWTYTRATPWDRLQAFLPMHEQNFSGVESQALTRWIEELEAEQDSTQWSALSDRINQWVTSDQIAVLPLTHPANAFLLGPRVNRFAMTPFGDPDLVAIDLKK